MKGTVRTVLAAAALAAALTPAGASAQWAPSSKFFGAHLGLSGVGSAPAIGLNGEFAYNDRIGIGAWLDTWSYGEEIGAGTAFTDWDVRYIALAGTGAYHFAVASNPKWDPFLGLALGYYVVSTSVEGNNNIEYTGDANRIFLGGFGGTRYHFKENLSGVARVGFGASYLTVGVDMKL